VQSVTHQNLGIIIAYILPGFTALWGLSCFSPTVQAWLHTSAGNSSTVGAFLFVVLASLGLGVFANLLRGLLLDPLQQRTGIAKREWSYRVLQENIAAIEFLVVNQFRYYQFAGNMFVVVLFTAIGLEICLAEWTWPFHGGCVVLEVVLWCGARQNLRTYYRRLDEVLSPGSAHSAAAVQITL
jgi:hypothetical protein